MRFSFSVNLFQPVVRNRSFRLFYFLLMIIKQWLTLVTGSMVKAVFDGRNRRLRTGLLWM